MTELDKSQSRAGAAGAPGTPGGKGGTGGTGGPGGAGDVGGTGGTGGVGGEGGHVNGKRTVRDRLIVTIVIVLALIFSAIGFGTLRSNKIAENTRTIAQINKKNNGLLLGIAKQLLDYQDPTSETSKRAQKATGDAIASVNLVTIYAAGCVQLDHVSSWEQLQTCVGRHLASGAPVPLATPGGR